MPPSFYKSFLSNSLALNGAETEAFVQGLTTMTGETVTFAEFSPFTRGLLVIDPEGSNSVPEICSFTGVDATGIGFTGLTRGLSSINSNTRVTGNMPYHPVGTPVIISWGAQNISDLLTYVASLVAGNAGNSSLTTAGITKTTSNFALATSPRARHAYVGQNGASGALTLITNPMAIQTNVGTVVVPQTTTAAYSAPSSHPRIDLLCYNTITAALAYRTGTEAISPSAPLPQEGDVVMCSVFHRVAETKILEQDDSNNGYILNWYEPIPFSIYPPTGVFLPFGGSAAPTGYLLCDGTAYSRTTYASLFTVLSTNWGVGDGSTTFNVPDFRGRGFVGAGTGTKTFTISGNSGSTLTVTSPTGIANSVNNEIQTGTAIVFNATVAGNLVTATTYYVVRQAYNQFKLSTTLANALGTYQGTTQTPTTISLAGTETGTFTLTLSTRSVGDTGGEENHVQTGAEMVPHTHNLTGSASTNSTFPLLTGVNGGSSSGSSLVASGGGLGHNTMMPYGVGNWIVKT